MIKRMRELARQLPEKPGVYLMKDDQGTILYVGKASCLKDRVSSYFSGGQLPEKTERLVARVTDIDFFVTGCEEEAIVLELNLIKRHRPYYNIRLKDDKGFPYLKIDVKEDWPRVEITRNLKDDGSRYFGPFASGRSVRMALQVIKNIFPFRSCTKPLDKPLPRPCLEYDIHKCLAPCVGKVTKKEYAETINQLTLFLEGRHDTLVRQLKAKMRQAVAALEYERAAWLRDQIKAIDEIITWQRMAVTTRGEQDVVAFAQDGDRAFVQVFFIRGGRIVGREGFILQGTQSEEPEEIMSSFVTQFYNSAFCVPPLILLQYPVKDREAVQAWLCTKKGSRVSIQVPRKGNRKRLMDTVAENARQMVLQQRIKGLAAPETLDAALEELKRELALPRLPERIEGYDISNIQGKAAVGSMVVFEHGKPRTGLYRRFRIKTVPAADDYAMMREIIQRRFGHLPKDKKSGAETWGKLPDLVLIDGGKGQLAAAFGAMQKAGASSIPAAGLAKEMEEIYLPGKPEPVRLPYESPGLQLLQRLRDEAHRFAVTYHRNIRKKQAFTSALDAIPGVGPKIKHNLLKQFGSVQAIRDASAEDLVRAKGVSQALAQRIKEHLG